MSSFRCLSLNKLKLSSYMISLISHRVVNKHSRWDFAVFKLEGYWDHTSWWTSRLGVSCRRLGVAINAPFWYAKAVTLDHTNSTWCQPDARFIAIQCCITYEAKLKIPHIALSIALFSRIVSSSAPLGGAWCFRESSCVAYASWP
jgi:hypothetical protein